MPGLKNISSQPVANPVRLSKKRLIAFKIIALLLPLVLLLLLEAVLRAVGYGHSYQLFVEDEQHKEYWVMNRYASQKYFTAQDNATIGNYERFKKQKSADTFRIFVLGESTTVGYPYLHNGSFHRWLQYRLMHTYPDQNFEVINLALTAVNSYTVWDFAQQLPQYQPDAVLIYTGHNEYYGALGVGSTSSLGSKPQLVRALLWLREFRLMQLLSAVYGRIKKAAGNKVDVRENLMKRMAAGQQIPYQSQVYERGIRQFKTNMEDLARLLHKHHLPVFISNLVSNEKDLKPFISDTSSQERSAIYQFTKATVAFKNQDFTTARELYKKARELDLLRFRAPEAINQSIQQIARNYPNVYLVDAQARFEKQSPHGIIGRETLLEHVHPNLFGYALLSDVFYEAIRAHGLLSPKSAHDISFEKLLQKMPVTVVDSLKGAYEILMLKEGWPFNEPMPMATQTEKTIEEKLAGALAVKQISWGMAMTQLLNEYLKEKQHAKALQVTEALLLEYPYDPAFYTQAGKLAMHVNRNPLAAFYLKKAFSLSPTADIARSLFIVYLKMDQPEEAVPFISYAISYDKTGVDFLPLMKMAQEIIALKAVAGKDTNRVQPIHQIAASYLMMGNKEAAGKYIEKALQIDPDSKISLEMLRNTNP